MYLKQVPAYFYKNICPETKYNFNFPIKKTKKIQGKTRILSVYNFRAFLSRKTSKNNLSSCLLTQGSLSANTMFINNFISFMEFTCTKHTNKYTSSIQQPSSLL